MIVFDNYSLMPHEKHHMIGSGILEKTRDFVDAKYRKFYGVAPKFAGENHWIGHNFTGPGTQVEKRLGLGPPYSVPVDAVDACAKSHDIDYMNTRKALERGTMLRPEAIRFTRDSDNRFINCVNRAKPSGINSRLAKFIVGDIIKSKNFLENVGLMDPLKFVMGKEKKEELKNGKGLFKQARTITDTVKHENIKQHGKGVGPLVKFLAVYVLPQLAKFAYNKIKDRLNDKNKKLTDDKYSA